MAQIIEFDIAIFGEKIFICISPTLYAIKKLFPKITISSSYENTHLGLSFGGIHKDGMHRRVIWLKRWNVSTFLHEAYHATKYILDHAGVVDHETGAYLIEFIYKETVRLKNKK